MGVLAFELLTGTNPFGAEKLAEVFERIIRAPLPELSAYSPGLPPALDAFFARAFSRTLNERIPSAKEFALQFRRAISVNAQVVPPAKVPSALAFGTTEEIPHRRFGRRPGRAKALGIWLVVLAGAALSGWLVAQGFAPTAAMNHPLPSARAPRTPTEVAPRAVPGSPVPTAASAGLGPRAEHVAFKPDARRGSTDSARRRSTANRSREKRAHEVRTAPELGAG